MVPIVGWGQTNVSTSYLPYATAIPDGSFAYTVAGVDGDYLDLKQIEGSQIPANTPVILAESELPNSGVANASASEYLLGTLVNQSVTIETGYSYFQLNVEDAIWYKATGESFVNDAGKAYLKFSDSMVAGKEKLYTIKNNTPQNSCGENLTWTLTDGELVIEGTGAMYNFEDEAAPWFASKDEIVKLTIKSGVTSVGDYAFNKCDKITDVVISNGVTTLGTHAFGFCDGLTVVSLPASVKTIGWSAFYTCRNLTTVNLSEGVTRIGEYSFADCRNLSKLNIPEGVTEIGQWAFRNCSFTSLILPSTLKTIQSCAFYECCELTSLTCLATTPPGLWGEAFATMNLSVPIYVPSGSVDAYKSKEQWNAFTIKVVCSSESDHNFVNGICTKCGAYEPAVDSNSDGYYKIGNAGQLYWFAEYVNSGNYSARAVLTADIDLENRPWTPIGYFNDAVDPYIDLHYRGIFDGQNHIIKNLNVHITDGSEAGFFSRTRDASLRNFGIVNATVISDPLGDKSSRAGVVGGELHYTTVDNVYTCGNITVITEYPQKGGIAGESSATRLNNCYTTYGILTPTKDVSVNNCFYLGNETNASSAGSFMTVEQMASGEMAYKLGNAYGQTIGTDASPVLGGAKVNYGYISCTATEKAYSNSEVRETQGHNYIDGVCEHCSDVAEACWGASLERLTSWGTYSEAISAAEAGRAAYVKLNKDVTSVTEIHSGTFTLDVNGHVMRVSDYVLNIKGANVTITDSSDGPVGILHNDNFWHRAIMASNGATVYIEKVQVMGAGAVEVLESSNVTIASGTYSSTEHPTVENKSGTLTILGGTFQTETEATVTSIKSAIRTTISGGTFAEGYDATIIYETGVLDLSGWANPAGISVYTYDDVPLGASTISLPTDYLFFNGEEVATEVLNPGTKYTIRKAEIFTVAFDANGGTGEMEDVSTYSNYRLPECTFTAPEGKMFKAWSVNEVEYQPNAVITVAGNTTITAVWATPYTLAFSANGGVGSLVALKTSSTVTLPECPFLAPEGKEFKAWRIGENEYAAGSVATLTEDAVAYAVWNDALVVHELDVAIFPMIPDAGEGATVRIMRDGIEIDRVEITVAGEPAHCWIPYDSNREYTFYWESRLGDSSWEVDVNIHLGPELIFHEFGHYLEHEYRDRPFLTIPAKASAGSTLETLNIIDGELPEYNVLREAEVGTLTYQRTLPNLEWNALFLPFEIPLSELEADYEVAYFNDMHSYDRNRDGEIDELEMEIILIDEGTLHANHPYFIRATSDDAKDLDLVLNDVTICETENAQLTCSSVYTKFDLNGSYAKKSAAELEGCYAISTEGAWAPLADGTALNPFRFYLEITQLAGSPVKVSSHALKSIRIRLNGQGDTTDIQEVPTTTTDAAVYDLSGRRVVNPGKGVYIVNGKKVMMK